jgi:drug/metabolite transporter (DMT)-like permease
VESGRRHNKRMKNEENELAGGEGFAILAATLWGINYPLVKSILAWIPEPEFLLLRFAGAVTLSIIYLITCGNGVNIEREHLGCIVVLGILVYHRHLRMLL